MITDFSACVSRDGRCARLTLRGDVDLSRVEELERQAELAIGDGAVSRLVVDLGGVDFMDACGLGGLLQVRDSASRAGIGLELHGVRPRVARVLEISGLDRIFEIRPDSDPLDRPAW